MSSVAEEQSKKWRCPEPRLEGRGYCPYHLHMIRETYNKRKHRMSSNVHDLPPNLPSQRKSHQIALDLPPNLPLQVESRQMSLDLPANLPSKVESRHIYLDLSPNLPSQMESRQLALDFPENLPSQERPRQMALDLHQNLTSPGKYRQIVLDFSLLAEIDDEKDLSEFLSMDSWKVNISPAEKQRLLCFLPEGEQCEGFVEFLLIGNILRFGINPAKEWRLRVCNGELHQEALLLNEEKLKALKCQFYRDLVALNRTSISEAEELKRLCFDICQSNERKFRMQIRKLRKKERRHVKH